MGIFVNLILKRPWLVVSVYGVLAGVGAIAAGLWLDLKTDTNTLVSKSREYNQRYHRYLEAFGDQEYMYVVIEVDDLATAMKVADAIADGVEPLIEQGYVKECVHRLSIESLRRGALLYLPQSDLESLASFVERNGDALRAEVDRAYLAAR